MTDQVFSITSDLSVNAQLRFYVTIMKGVTPVSGLEVTANVLLPSATAVPIKLMDNGAGMSKYKLEEGYCMSNTYKKY